ncbi:ABC transporter substrate-binding protein [Gemmobacter serpentinus]|uniref:ABC transporter substrate-binding protein n=1 Tax=Gemmobacter serpentinus TaxID=2652247 RepID=UPI00124DBE19|nr:ABC transporter substrate-binding protein [Gemmobacter serpentinus]
MSRLLCLLILTLIAALPARAEEITLRHGLGETTFDPAKVQRIVSVGYHEQDFLYGLGLAPVGVHEWFGDRPYATWSWAEGARAALNATPEVQNGMEIDVEWVWSMEPDLIIATFAPLDPQTYAQLSQIAPVIGQPEGYPRWGAPWDVELRLIAQATAREAEADAMIARIQAQINAAAKAYPQFKGHSGTAASFTDGQIIGYPVRDGGNRLLGALGLQSPAEFDTLSGDRGNFMVSPERLDMFDLDVVLWQVDAPSRAVIETLPSWQATRMAREGRAIWTDEEMIGAMSFQSPLSISWALDRLILQLDAALDGDPATGTDLPQ